MATSEVSPFATERAGFWSPEGNRSGTTDAADWLERFREGARRLQAVPARQPFDAPPLIAERPSAVHAALDAWRAAERAVSAAVIDTAEHRTAGAELDRLRAAYHAEVARVSARS